GNTAALRELFEQNKRRLYGLAFQYTRNAEDAEDILQETFIKAFRNLDSYRIERESGFAAWLFRIGVNASIDYLRRHKARRAEAGEESLAAVPAQGSDVDPEEVRRLNECRERIRASLDALSAKQRMVFLLRHERQCSIREIAGQLRCTEGSVKTHLFRAVAALRTRLGPTALEDRS
ncbi:MAG: RNA polymerase sigma factor, partial [Candidatus Aminicenantes bacterium]|nr:RNA polymerase sigma factor [Candidatus Aminicenantes bacterium]